MIEKDRLNKCFLTWKVQPPTAKLTVLTNKHCHFLRVPCLIGHRSSILRVLGGSSSPGRGLRIHSLVLPYRGTSHLTLCFRFLLLFFLYQVLTSKIKLILLSEHWLHLVKNPHCNGFLFNNHIPSFPIKWVLPCLLFSIPLVRSPFCMDQQVINTRSVQSDMTACHCLGPCMPL